MQPKRHFASDNNAPIHPDILKAIEQANSAHVRAYGDDPWTAAMETRFREHFGADARAFVVFNGTGANTLALSSMLRPHEAVVCAEHAHVSADECGAPERYAGCKLVLVHTETGKLRPSDVESKLGGRNDQHRVQPRVVSITQSTEVGTVYTPDEIRALSKFCRSNGLLLHMDGARIANAAASLKLPLAAITTDVGVDVLSFGGTKNGCMGAEAVVFLKKNLGQSFAFERKQGMQLASKMRFISAQLARLLGAELWRTNAEHANKMAKRLAAAVNNIQGVKIVHPVEANGVFAAVPRGLVLTLQERSFFYVWDESVPVVRWMCSWDTTESDVDQFAAAIREILSGAAAPPRTTPGVKR